MNIDNNSTTLRNTERIIRRRVQQFLQDEMNRFRETTEREIHIREKRIFELENKVNALEMAKQVSDDFIDKLEFSYKEVIQRLTDRIGEYKDIESQIFRMSNQKKTKPSVSFHPSTFAKNYTGHTYGSSPFPHDRKEKSDLDYLKFVEWEKANRHYYGDDESLSSLGEDINDFRNDGFVEETGKEIYQDL